MIEQVDKLIKHHLGSGALENKDLWDSLHRLHLLQQVQLRIASGSLALLAESSEDILVKNLAKATLDRIGEVAMIEDMLKEKYATIP